jgi:hypothetical protein
VKSFRVKDPSVVAALLDFFFSFCALYLFYRLTVDHLPIAEEEQTKERALRIALFLIAILFTVSWILPWQRPETLPTALFLAIALFCLVRARRNVIWPILFLIAIACQGFVRSDVPFVFGATLFVMSFFGKTLEEFGSRTFNLLMGACAMLIAGTIQLYLQDVRYPHLTYWPGTDVVQLRNNLHLHALSNCLLAILPFLLVAAILIRRRVSLKAVEAVAVVSSILYFLLWFTVGSISEVRIYVPFLFMLSVVAARALMPASANEFRASEKE